MANSSTTPPIVEKCWTLTGRRRGRIWYARRIVRTSGTPSTVAFDAHWVLHREESRGDVAGFMHTHPNTDPTPSRRDVRTMRAWCSALGKPLLCVIVGKTSTAAYRFNDGRSAGERLAEAETFPRGIVVAVESAAAEAHPHREAG